jgi:hypothetical protein
MTSGVGYPHVSVFVESVWISRKVRAYKSCLCPSWFVKLEVGVDATIIAS